MIDKVEHITTQWFKRVGDVIILLGDAVDSKDPLQGLGGSAYLQRIHGLKTGTPPRCDLDREKSLNALLLESIRMGWIQSAHDCSDGGLAVALAESCISNHAARETPVLIGADVDLSSLQAARQDALLFGESQARIVISVPHNKANQVLAKAKKAKIPATRIGVVGGVATENQNRQPRLCMRLG